MRRFSTLAIMMTCAIGLTGCSTQPDAPSNEIPNPAAVFCVKQGGTYHLESGDCRLKEGRTVDVWTYYREHHGQ